MWQFVSDWKLAVSGAEAQFSAALRLWKMGDKRRALRWGRRAAERIPLAKVVVAQWLLLRNGSAETREAMELLTSAAESGSPEAQQVLSACYLHGDRVPKDPQKAIYWTRRQADGGDLDAQIAMVEFLTSGEYCEVNAEEALHYATLAAAAGRSEFLAALVKDLQDEAAAQSGSPQVTATEANLRRPT